MIGVDDRLVVALVTTDRGRPDAELAHVAKRHGLNRIVESRPPGFAVLVRWRRRKVTFAGDEAVGQ
jgi:hypothetical protein